jgi:hypothetical protein
MDLGSVAPAGEIHSLGMRHARYERHRLLRRRLPRRLAGLVLKPHKPKIISAHYAATVAHLRSINGFDEGYAGYGYEDDDLGRRLHALLPQPRTAIAVRDIRAYHLWHPSRAPRRPTEAPGYARFCEPYSVFAKLGWKDPAPQPEPAVRIVPA